MFNTHPKAKYWSSKNNISPDQISLESHKKVWFKCNKSEHEFESTLTNIVQNNQWCPYPCCAKPSKKLCSRLDCQICLNASFASQEKSKFWSNKNELNPRNVLKMSSKKFWFKCDKLEHEFETVINYITKNKSWCPYPCCSKRPNLCLNDKCKICFESSFASHPKVNLWSDKNKQIPRQVTIYSGKKFLFKCSKSNHEWEASLSNITNMDSDCPYPCCSGLKLCSEDSCKICYDASFASIKKLKYWSDKNHNKPRQVMKGSSVKYHFVCENKHEFEMRLDHVSKDSWCGECSGRVNGDINKLISKFILIHGNKYDYSKIKDSINCKLKVNIICKKHGEFTQTPDSHVQGKGCPFCQSYINENMCIDILKKLSNEHFTKMRLKYLDGLEIDGFNEKLMLGIEYNGEQHYKYIEYFHKGNKENFIKQQERDNRKIELCNQYGIYLIIVPFWIKNKHAYIVKEYENYLFLHAFNFQE